MKRINLSFAIGLTPPRMRTRVQFEMITTFREPTISPSATHIIVSAAVGTNKLYRNWFILTKTSRWRDTCCYKKKKMCIDAVVVISLRKLPTQQPLQRNVYIKSRKTTRPTRWKCSLCVWKMNLYAICMLRYLRVGANTRYLRVNLFL